MLLRKIWCPTQIFLRDSGKSVHLQHERSMLGVHCHWSFVGDILGYLKIFFVDFCDQCFCGKIGVKLKFLNFTWFLGLIWKCLKCIGRSKKLSQENILTWELSGLNLLLSPAVPYWGIWTIFIGIVTYHMGTFLAGEVWVRGLGWGRGGGIA